MRAAVLNATGDDHVVVRDDLEVPEPGPGQVRVRVAATGVCHSDLSAMNGTFPQPAPAVLGHEGAGVVVALGEGVTAVKAGDHVIAAWMAPCGACKVCRGGQPNLCITHFQHSAAAQPFRAGDEVFYAMAGTGTWAEEIILLEGAAIPIDPSVPLDVAALIGCGVTTGVGAVLNAGRVQPGSSVAVFGMGGVGMSAVQAARIAGASVIVAVDPVEAKHELALGLGATHAATPEGLGALSGDLTGGDGFDYVIEAVGRPQTIRAAYDATRRGGAVVVVGMGGFADEVAFNAFELAWNEKRILGSMYGSADVWRDFPRLLEFWRAGDLDLEAMISRSLPLEAVNEALRSMAAGEVIRQVLTF